MNVWKWGRREKIKPTADPFRRLACHWPLINKWEGVLPHTPAFKHQLWIQQLREGYFKADSRASHELVIGYSLANSSSGFWLLYRAQYTIEKDSEAYQIVDGLAWLLLDASEPSEVRLERNSLLFHQEFWPLAVERLYEEIRKK